MIIVNINEGTKIDYTVNDKTVTFGGALSVNLAELEEDWPVHIDICSNAAGALVIGTTTGRRYVAEIDIPERQYQTTGEGEDETLTPVPLDMDTVKLTLWALE